jgi:hypothetical protein
MNDFKDKEGIDLIDIQALQRLKQLKSKMELSTVEKQLFTYHSLLLIKQKHIEKI